MESAFQNGLTALLSNMFCCMDNICLCYLTSVHFWCFSRHTLLTPALLSEMDTEYFPETGAWFPTPECAERPRGLIGRHYLIPT